MLGVVGLFYGAYFFIAIFACRTYCVLFNSGLDNVPNVKQSL